MCTITLFNIAHHSLPITAAASYNSRQSRVNHECTFSYIAVVFAIKPRIVDDNGNAIA